VWLNSSGFHYLQKQPKLKNLLIFTSNLDLTPYWQSMMASQASRPSRKYHSVYRSLTGSGSDRAQYVLCLTRCLKLLESMGLATAETAIPSKPSKNFLIFKSDRIRPPYYGQMGYRTRKKRRQASPPLYRHPSILNFQCPTSHP
jgi:hypothetical protein